MTLKPADLEQLVDTRLRALPVPTAPLTLLPRVMAAVAQWAARPWYRRAWFTWPPLGQFATLVGLLWLSVAFVGLVALAVRPLAGTAAASLSSSRDDVERVAGYVRLATEVGVTVWRAVLEPIVPYAFVLVLLMCLACAAFGAALNYAVSGRMSEG
jgi:hypothetical protein